MPQEVLERITAEILKVSRKRIKFLWHGGEPMLTGIDFYRRAVECQKRYRRGDNQIIDNHIQTNATLIDDRWAKFFKENDFKVSTSIDGPEQLHNRFRFTKDGRGSFQKVIKGIKILSDWGMNVGVVTTINCINAKYPEEVYDTLIGLGLKGFEFNVVSNAPGAEPLTPSEKDAVTFLKRTFDKWFENDDPSIHVRLFVNVLRSFCGFSARDCSFVYNRCREFIACDEKGDLYTCGRFLKEPAGYIGSCFSNPLYKILSSDATKELYKKVSLIHDECRSCEWLYACGGGCAYQRWLNGGFGSKFPQCGIRRKLFKHIKQRMEQCR
jgi:uncharacterized protein